MLCAQRTREPHAHTHSRAQSKRARARADAVVRTAQEAAAARRNEEVRAQRRASRTHASAVGCAFADRSLVCCTSPLPRWLVHGVCCMMSAARRLLRILRAGTVSAACRLRRAVCVVCCTLSPALLSTTRCAQPRTSARTRTRMRARTHVRAHTRACESMRIGMVGNGAGAGGSQAGGRGAAPVATIRSCACCRHHADGSNWCALAAARLSYELLSAAMSSAARVSCALSSAACRRLHCRLHVLCRTSSRCVGAFRSIRRVWCTLCVTPAAARFLLLVFAARCRPARCLLHVVCCTSSVRARHIRSLAFGCADLLICV